MVQRCLQVTSGEWVLYHRRQQHQHQHHHHHHPNVLADACSLYALSSLSEEPYSVSQSRGASVTDKECLPAWAMRMQPKVKWQCRSKGTSSFKCTKSWEPADVAVFWWPKVRPKFGTHCASATSGAHLRRRWCAIAAQRLPNTECTRALISFPIISSKSCSQSETVTKSTWHRTRRRRHLKIPALVYLTNSAVLA